MISKTQAWLGSGNVGKNPDSLHNHISLRLVEKAKDGKVMCGILFLNNLLITPPLI